ncbi:MAG: immunoglobulin domain-containing protein, partial [Limisphaerales bacterium]
KIHVYRVPLAVAVPPQNQTAAAGAPATFTVTAYGTPPLDFQWRFNGSEISGATSSAYTIPNVQPQDAGNYDVIVRDYSGAVTSSAAVLTVAGTATAPGITIHPQDRTTGLGGSVTLTVTATGSEPLHYQWQKDGNPLGSSSSSLVLTNVQLANAGSYSVLVSNALGSVTSEPAILTVVPVNAFIFQDDFDDYAIPSVVTSAGTANGYHLRFGAASGPQDFLAIFGFDYSNITFPISIPSAPNSKEGSTKGLFLRVNKDATAAAAAVNLYPVGITASNDFSLKFDLWMNWTNIGSASEHALFGINHSGTVTNRVSQNTSDGLFFAMNSDGNVSSTASQIRDFAVFRGGGPGGAPILMLTN